MSEHSHLTGSGKIVVGLVLAAVIAVGGVTLLNQTAPKEPEPAPTITRPAPETNPIRTIPAPKPEPQTDPVPRRPVEAMATAKIPVSETVEMPEEPVDDTPVVLEEPHLVVAPVHGDVIAAFSMDKLQYDPTMDDWRTHDGQDIAAAEGTNVLAAASGKVTAVTNDPMLGTMVVIAHDGGFETLYANLQKNPPVKAGEKVTAGQIIGAVGHTAKAEAAEEPHLHFAVKQNGQPIDPTDFLSDE